MDSMDLTLIKDEIPDDLITESSEIGFDCERAGTENIHDVNASSAAGVEFPLFVLAGYCRLNSDGSCGVRMDLDLNNGRVACPTVIVPAARSVEYSGISLDCLAASHASQLQAYSSRAIDHVRHSSFSYNCHLPVDNKLQPVVRLIKLSSRQIQNATGGHIKILKSKPAAISYEDNRQSCVCPICGRAFRSLWMLNRHISYHDRLLISSTQDSSQHLCLTCGKSFKCASKLRFHEARHIQKSKHIRIVPTESDIDVDVEALSDNDFSCTSNSGVDVTYTELIEVKPDTADSDTMDYHRSMRSSESDVEVDCGDESNIDRPVAVFSDKKTLDTDGNTKAACTVDQSDQKVPHGIIAGKCSTSADVAVVRGNDNLRSYETNLQSRNIFEHFPSVMSSENCLEAVHFDFRTSSYVAEFEKRTPVDACSDASWNNSNTTEIAVDTKAKSDGKPKCATSVTSNDQAEDLHFKCTDSGKKFKQYTRLCGSQEYCEKMGETCTHSNYVCPKCDEAFTSHSSFQQHVVLHLEDSPQQCQQSAEVVSQQIERNCVRNCSKPCRAHHSVSGVRANNGGGLHYGSQSKNSNSQASDLRHYCEICGMSFKLIFVLKRHLKIHGFGVKGRGTRNYVCPDCYKSFQGMNTFLKHLKLHSENYPHVCDVCSKRCTSAGALRQHNRLNHDDSKKHVCGQCGKIFPLAISLIRHKRAHSKKRHVSAKPSRHCCQICGISFKFISVLKRHLKIHGFGVKGRGARNYVCPDCYKSFQGMNAFLKHLKLHSENYPHVCDVCSKRCTSAGALRQHNRLNHDDSKKHVCGQCGKIFPLAISLIRHKRAHSKKRHVSAKPSRHCCQICGISFKFISVLKRHLKIHGFGVKGRGARNYVCPDCYKSFQGRNTFLKLLKLHSENYPHVCDVCSKRCTSAGALREHNRLNHDDSKKHACGQCGKIFPLAISLIRHKRAHSKKRHVSPKPSRHGTATLCGSQEYCEKMGETCTHSNYICPNCDKAFTSHSSFQQHVVLHLEDSPQQCQQSSPQQCQQSAEVVSQQIERNCVGNCSKPCRAHHSVSGVRANNGGGLHYGSQSKNSNSQASDLRHYCEICGMSFKLIFVLKRHLKIHGFGVKGRGTRNYVCPDCYKSFQGMNTFLKHLKLHSENYPHVCDVCSKRCTSAGALRQHNRLNHDDSKKHVCGQCGKIFPLAISLIRHKRAHSKKRHVSAKPSRHCCQICGISFKFISVLKRHLKIHGFGVKGRGARNYVCPDCYKSFQGRNTFLKHLKLHSENYPHVCDVCSKRCTSAGALREHNRLNHDDSKKHACGQCGKIFPLAISLIRHKRAHSKKRHVSAKPSRHCCQMCGMSFKVIYALKRHLKMHEFGRVGLRVWNYVCPDCNKTFECRDAFLQHLDLHSENYPHVCGECGKRCTSAGALRQHSRLNHDDSKKHACGQCGKVFQLAISLIRHKIVHSKKTCASTKALSLQLNLKHDDRATVDAQKSDKSENDLKHFTEMTACLGAISTSDPSDNSSIPHVEDMLQTNGMLEVTAGSTFDASDNVNISHFADTLQSTDNLVASIKIRRRLDKGSKSVNSRSLALNLYSHHCHICGLSFNTIDKLTRHAENHKFCHKGRGAPNYVCPECHTTFQHRNRFMQHLELHSENHPHICDVCNKRCFSATALKKHYELYHDNSKELVCEQCGKIFYLAISMISHKISHSVKTQKNYPHVCDVCNKRCSSAEALLQHFNLRHDCSTEHRCERCGKVFTAKIRLIYHHHRCPAAKSLNVNVYSCTRCSKSFRYPSMLRRHVLRHHNLIKKHKLLRENGIDWATSLASGITALGGLDENSEHAGVESNAGLNSSILADDSITHQTNRVAIDASNVECSKQAGDISVRLSGSCSDADKLVTPFVCERCGKSFQFAADLGEHDRQFEQGVNSDTAFMCCHCCKSFISKCAVRQHMYMISDSNPYKCSVCQKVSPSAELFAQHKLQGCDSQTCSCVDCGEKFTNNFSLIKHLEIKHGNAARQRRRRKKKQVEQPLICSECGKLFRQAYRLEAHLKRHSGERPYICDYCSSSFVDCQSLNNHRRSRHINIILGKYPCTVCDKKCGSKQLLTQHMNKHDRKPAAAVFSCDSCTCKFKSENFIRKHVKTVHLGIPRASKAVSGQTPNSKTKRFACRFCLRSFNYKQTMLDHECIHTGVKRFRCSECEKSFITKTQLDEHAIVMHCNVKAFACPDCGRKFALRKAMNRHIKNVHNKGAQPKLENSASCASAN